MELTAAVRARGWLRRDAVRISLLVLAIAGSAVGVYAAALRGHASAGVAGITMPWWGLALIFLATEAYPVHLHFRSETHTLSLSEFGVVLGLYLGSPQTLLAGALCGTALALVVARRQRPLKIAFNLAQFALSSCVAFVIFDSAVALGRATGPVGWAGAIASASAFGVTGVALVTVTISVALRRSVLRELPTVSALAVVSSVASGSLAVAVVALMRVDAEAIWLLIIPAACCALAFRAYATQRRRHEHLEFLYQSMRAMQSATELREAVRELLITARAMLSAEFAELVLASPAADGALRCVIDADGGERLETAPLGAADLAAVAEASSHDGAILLARGRKRHPLDPYLAERGVADAMLAALRRDDRIFGLLLVGDRSGDVSTFNADDRKLFETFASHAGVLLENDRVKEQLRYQAFHDTLTGLPNRALFAERVARALEPRPGAAAAATVLFLDLDDFKTINDSLGHKAGDELLIAVAERVRGCVGPADTAARLGGDEFGILLTEPERGLAERTATLLVDALRAPFVLHGRELAIHASIGIASARAGVTADELLANADVAMYSAKGNGKRRYAVYEPQMHTRVRRRHELAAALEHAVERAEIAVHYQPIVALGGGRTVALEALARWHHPTRGLVLPGSFVPLAEETGLMVPIGRSVLREACRRAAEWHARFPTHSELAISVNLSASELQSPNLVRDLKLVLAESGLAPQQLIFEITESGAMRDPQATLETLRALGSLGVRLALDDFGTGYSSLSHLRDFPIDILKIAKPFVDRLGDGSYDTTFTDAILRLAGALDLDIVAEGIERADQAEILRSLDCALGQGYYFARPFDAAGAEAYLAAGAPAGLPRARIRAA